jgi:hypothetical protein
MKHQTMYKLGFAVVYTLVMLPFSVTFFHHIASPPDGSMFMGLFPLSAAHNLVLPLFLAILEFSSINVAFLLWARTETVKRKAMLALLFLCCQSFPVMSIYYDIIAREYTSVTTSVSDVRDDSKDRIRTVKLQISDIKADIKRLTHDHADVSSLMSKKAELFMELSALQTQKQTASASRVSELEYVRGSVGTQRGTLPMFLAFMFPVIMLTFARVIKPEPRTVGEHVAPVRKKKRAAKKAAPVVQLGEIIG